MFTCFNPLRESAMRRLSPVKQLSCKSCESASPKSICNGPRRTHVRSHGLAESSSRNKTEKENEPPHDWSQHEIDLRRLEPQIEKEEVVRADELDNLQFCLQCSVQGTIAIIRGVYHLANEIRAQKPPNTIETSHHNSSI